MELSPRFLRVASVCALLSAATTVAVHWLPALWVDADTFQEQLELPNNRIYMGRSWLVLLHCVLVVVSMFGVGFRRLRQAPALISLGFLAFVLFATTEIFRTSLSIFATNRTWRAGYAAGTDEGVRESMRDVLMVLPGVNATLFFIFFCAFVTGTFCYGFALAQMRGAERKIGWLFLFWGVCSLPTFIDEISGSTQLANSFEWVGLYFQPVARAVIGVWLWTVASRPVTLTG